MFFERHNLFGFVSGITFDFNDRPLGCNGERAMTPLERKIIRRAAEIVAATDLSCTVSLVAAMSYYDHQTPILEIFRDFFGVGDFAFAGWQG